MKRLTVIGGGLSGLVAAIAGANAGWEVRLFEANRSFGGRARSLSGPYRANLGPHAVYVDGALWSWLIEHGLAPVVVEAPPKSTWFCTGGRLYANLSGLGQAIGRLPATAPTNLSFRDWLCGCIEPSIAEALIGLVFVTVYDHDPGRLSAPFMRERLMRTVGGTARYVVGGWSSLVEGLTKRCGELNVEMRPNTRVAEVEDHLPTILATTLRDARRLTNDGGLHWPSAETALLDVALKADRGIDWFRVLDVDARIYMARYTAIDPTLAPAGEDLIQIAVAHWPTEPLAISYRRAEGLLDIAWPGWRGRVQWSRRSVMRGLTGAIDGPGFCWRDRPQVTRRPGLHVATDQSAAPGMLAEVGVAAALAAVATADAV